MMSSCDSVAERTALGESLGDLADHVATCERCQRVVDMPSKLGATRHEVDPGLGFSARMTVGAQQRLAVRRRRRIAVGLASTVAAGAFGVFLMMRTPGAPAPSETPTSSTAIKDDQPKEPVLDVASDDDLKALVDLADVDRSSRISARWSHIRKPLAPYRKLVEGVTP
jgi:hypothetical protein